MNNYLRNTLIMLGTFTVSMFVNSFFVIPLTFTIIIFSLFVYQDIFRNSRADELEQKIKILADRLTSLERKTNTKL